MGACVATQRHVIAGHTHLAAQGGGLLTDGMGTGGQHVSGAGQDRATVQAGAGQCAELDLRVLYMAKRNNLRVTVDGGGVTLLSGTVLPPAEGGGRRFRSKPGGKIEVLLVTGDIHSLSFVSLSVQSTCVDASGCGAHGSCNAGNCTCSNGYTGMGMCSLPPLWVRLMAIPASRSFFVLRTVAC